MHADHVALQRQTFDVWHDRAAFHFPTDSTGRAAYAEDCHSPATRRTRHHRDIYAQWPRALWWPARRAPRCDFSPRSARSLIRADRAPPRHKPNTNSMVWLRISRSSGVRTWRVLVIWLIPVKIA